MAYSLCIATQTVINTGYVIADVQKYYNRVAVCLYLNFHRKWSKFGFLGLLGVKNT
jgi:hypothetical protein